MKIFWRLLAVLAIVICSVSPALAGDHVTITITAQPWAVGNCPTNFVINAVSDYEIQLSWTPGGNTTGTEIRGAYGRWPGNATDGFEVYNGNATLVTHWINTEFIGVDVYYRAWGIVGGNYSLCYASGTVQGGEDVAAIGTNLLIGLMLIAAVGTSGIAVAKKWSWLFGTAAALWAVIGMYGLNSGDQGSIYNAIGWLGIAGTVLFIFAAIMYRDKSEAEEQGKSWEDDLESSRAERYARRAKKREEPL